MKALAAACGVLLLALAGCGASEWRELAVSEGGFSVLMRGQPHYVRQQVDTGGGMTYAHLYSSDRPDAYFAVGYSDFPIAQITGTPPGALFTGVRDTWVKRIDGKLTSSSETRIDKYPGLEFTAQGKVKGADTLLEGRLYLVDQRLYQVIALSRKGEISQGVVNRFLQSFRLIPVSAAAINIAPPEK